MNNQKSEKIKVTNGSSGSSLTTKKSVDTDVQESRRPRRSSKPSAKVTGEILVSSTVHLSETQRESYWHKANIEKRRTSFAIKTASMESSKTNSGDGRRNNGGGILTTYQRQQPEMIEDDYDKDEAMDVTNPSFAITPVMPKSKSAMSSMTMSSLPEDFPQPSPAACGKRKEAELTAAKMLAEQSPGGAGTACACLNHANIL